MKQIPQASRSAKDKPAIKLPPPKKLLSLLGSLLLLSAWLTQQFLFEKWAERIATIDRCQSDFYTYQSNNALFNVLFELLSVEKQKDLRELQGRNYEYGLEHLREALWDRRRINLENEIAKRVTAYSSSFGDLAHVQAELEVIQDELRKEKTKIDHAKRLAQNVFWALYLLGSATIILGAFLAGDSEEIEVLGAE